MASVFFVVKEENASEKPLKSRKLASTSVPVKSLR